MKFLLLTEFFPADKELKFTGGVEARTFYIAYNLSLNDKVFVICRRTKGLEKFKKIGQISIYPCGLKTINVKANFFSVFERIIFIISAFFKGLSLKFDLIEGSNFIAYLPAYFLGLIKRKPKIAWYPDVLGKNWFKFFGITGFFGCLMEKLSLYFNWDQIIALSKSTKEKLIKGGVKKNKITVVYGGVDYKGIKSTKNIKSTKGRNIISIGRLVKYKRIEDLISAFNKLNNKYPQLSLIIVGQGPEEKRLKGLVLAKKLDSKVIFLQDIARKRLIQLIKQSDIFCLPSIIEGFGLVTIEAAACGVPYVISDIKVNREITQNGFGGLLFKAGEVDDLADKLQILLKDKDLYQKKAKEAIELAKNYDWQKIAQQTKEVYNKLYG